MRRPIEATDSIKTAWSWPIDVSRYDRNPLLYAAEADTCNRLRHRPRPGPRATYINQRIQQRLQRLVAPIHDCLTAIGATRLAHTAVISILVKEMVRRQKPYWAWSKEEWLDTLCPCCRLFRQRQKRGEGYRHDLIAVAYLLGQFSDLHALGVIGKRLLAEKVFGRQRVSTAIEPIVTLIKAWGGGRAHVDRLYPRLLAELFLLAGSPELADLTPQVFEQAQQGGMAVRLKRLMSTLTRALAALGKLVTPLPPTARKGTKSVARSVASGVRPEWAEWSLRWYETSTASPNRRHHAYYDLLKIGRWLASQHPELTSPAQWNRQLAAECVAVVDRMVVGQYGDPDQHRRTTQGKPLKPTAKDHLLGGLRTFFKDLQEWGWIEHRFDPLRDLATPRAIRALIAPDPRIISDAVWAKLLHAGLNLQAEDLPAHEWGGSPPVRTHWYPLEMVRCVALIWLFAGLRSDEILRLRVGCVRWHSEAITPSSVDAGPHSGICLLAVPTNKTSTAFTKPVDPLVGQAISEWEKVRPPQPLALDPKTGEMVPYLLSYRGQRLGSSYLNQRIIPLLCRKAGVPPEDARGRITSHRARATIATQLYNAKTPMTLFELMEWLGHHSPSATQHYAKITPTKLATAYAEADYFKRNLRTIEVLIDREAVLSGAAARGEPWQYYDLGHGYCTYDFFDQCPHRMACAKCSFYLPKEATKALLDEGQANLRRMRQEIRLTDEERAAVEEGIQALDQLTKRLAMVAAPDGRTPEALVQLTGIERA